jgi:hypothetical protein
MENYSVEDILPFLDQIKINVGDNTWKKIDMTSIYFKNARGDMFHCEKITPEKAAASKNLGDRHVGYYTFDSFHLPVEKMTEVFKSARLCQVDLSVLMHNNKFIQEITVLMSHLNADVLLAFHKYIQYNIYANFDYIQPASSVLDILNIKNRVVTTHIKVGNTFCYEDMYMGFICKKEIETEETEDGDCYRILFNVSHNGARLYCNIPEGIPILDKWAAHVGIMMHRNGDLRSYTGSINNSTWDQSLSCVRDLDKAIPGLEHHIQYHMIASLY